MKLKRQSDGAEIELSGEWKPVLVEPPERWVDVTAACRYGEPGYEFHGFIEHKHDKGFSHIAAFNRDGYRLRKIHIKEVEAHTLAETGIKTAFLVEKKEP